MENYRIITGKSKCGFTGKTTYDCAIVTSKNVLLAGFGHCKTPFIALLKTMRSYKSEYKSFESIK